MVQGLAAVVLFCVLGVIFLTVGTLLIMDLLRKDFKSKSNPIADEGGK